MNIFETISNFLKGKNKKYDDLTDTEKLELENQLNAQKDANNDTKSDIVNNNPKINTPEALTKPTNTPTSNTDSLSNLEILKMLQAIQEELNLQKKTNEDLLKRIEDDKKQQIKQKVDNAIKDATAKGKISPKDEESKKKWEKRLLENYDDQIEVLNQLPEKKFKLEQDNSTNNSNTSNANNIQKTLDRALLIKQAREAFKTNN